MRKHVEVLTVALGAILFLCTAVGLSSSDAQAQGAISRVRPLSPIVGRYVSGMDANGVWQTEALSSGATTYQAPGGGVEQSLADVLSRMVLVTNYMTEAERADIASGNPTLDLKASIQNAENALGDRGTLIFPKGVYLWDSTVLLSSNRHVKCEKGAVFKPRYRFSLFANDNWATIDLRTDLDPPTDANQTDHDFEISGCKFDWAAAVNADSPSLIWPYNNGHKPAIFVKAKNIYIHDNEFVASDPPKLDGATYYGYVGSVACVSSNNCRYERNIGIGMHESLDCWGGGNGCYYKDNRVELFDNQTFKRGDHYCLGFNGMGSIANFHNTIENLEVSGNYCITKGWSSCFQFDPLSAGSKAKNVKITNNVCEAKSGSTNNGIYGRGQIEDALIAGNTFIGMDALPINVTDFFSTGGPFNCTDCISTTNGSKNVVVAIPYTTAKIVPSNYLLFSTASPVGGITFAGKYFKVLSVNYGVSATVEADVPASSTAGPLGGSISTNVWWGAPRSVRAVNNNLLNSGYPNAALIQVNGENVQIGNNSAVNETFGPFTCTDCITTNGTTTAVVAMPDFTAETARVNDYLRFGAGVSPVGGVTFANKNFKITAVNPGVSVSVLMDGTATAATGGGSVSATVQRGLYGSITYASSFLRGTTLAPAPVVWGTAGVAGTGMAGASGDAIDSYPTSRHPQTSFPSIVLPHGNNPTAILKKDGQLWSEIAGFRARVGGVDTTFADLERAQTFTGAKLFTRAKLTAQGQCSMTAGVCSAQALGATYSVAPQCFVSWTGSGVLNGRLKVVSTTTNVTPSSSDAGDTAQVNWSCFGN